MAVEVVGLQRDRLQHEYGVDVQRLVPWAALNSPFEGAWAVVPDSWYVLAGLPSAR